MKELTESQEQQILALYDMEWSVTRLANWFECPRTMVRRVLRKHGQTVEIRQRVRGFMPTLEQIKQGATKFREAHLQRKKECVGRPPDPLPAAIRVVRVTCDEDGVYLEPV